MLKKTIFYQYALLELKQNIFQTSQENINNWRNKKLERTSNRRYLISYFIHTFFFTALRSREDKFDAVMIIEI